MEREIAETKKEEIGAPDPVSLVLPSSAEYVMLVRLVAGQVGRLAGFEPEDIYDLKLAVTEAVTNVIRHAAVDSYEVEYRVLPRAVEVTVTDAGGGFEVANLTGEPDEQGGFGLTVIRNLVDEFVLDSKGDGTRMKMVRRASEPGTR
ncbi:MAG: Serine-protein kinase RsbW [uncultured Rubrobacteraceae bacterium]|uniref:Serine-protein kinase RsbW n=1 Tax=uncultured Rubrobacteraceae bacterium TaxID=349277 RepID=A0A6J4RUE8_9ACTN|nr:MAG: Serine-protein kinase RsbW [uncultured Rubrobacteraceae bacterium]